MNGVYYYVPCSLRVPLQEQNSKHLMTGPSENSSFCFPRISMFPRGAAEGNNEIWGKQNEVLPEGPVIKWFVI